MQYQAEPSCMNVAVGPSPSDGVAEHYSALWHAYAFIKFENNSRDYELLFLAEFSEFDIMGIYSTMRLEPGRMEHGVQKSVHISRVYYAEVLGRALARPHGDRFTKTRERRASPRFK